MLALLVGKRYTNYLVVKRFCGERCWRRDGFVSVVSAALIRGAASSKFADVGNSPPFRDVAVTAPPHTW
jgi:hypothetical protein